MSARLLKTGIYARMPQHYIKHRLELEKLPEPVHYYAHGCNWKKDPETGEVYRVQDAPLPLKHVEAQDQGMWGGEMVIQGILKTLKRNSQLHPRCWFPELIKDTVYCEILDTYFRLIMTERTLELIDKNYGFDFYILKTPIQDLKSQLALDMRRKLLLTLIRKELYPTDEEKREKIFNKYKEFLIPEDEAEWFGLSLEAAKKKQLELENSVKPVPLKIQYRQELVERLKAWKESQPNEEPETSWISKLNPFSSKAISR